MESLQAVILERNRLVNRRVVRLLTCAGFDVTPLEDPALLVPAVTDQTALVCAEGFDVDLILQVLKAHPAVKVILWSGEPIDRLLRTCLEEPRLSNIIGRANFESTPRDWELLLAARRLMRPEPHTFQGLLSWGFTGFQWKPRETAERDAVSAQVQAFIDKIGTPKRVGEMFYELCHELLMNAMYDAPVDEQGRPKYAHDRKNAIQLEPDEAPLVRIGSDGVKVVLSVTDPFGRLGRHHVFGGLVRGLKGGEMDQSGGGAGLGMVKVYHATVSTLYDVVRGRKTEVTGVFDLDMNLREFRTLPKSVHFFQAG
jgi:hypothetical protein